VSVLWSIPTPHCHDKPDDGAAQLKPPFDHRARNEMGKQGIASNDHIRARHANSKKRDS
jgi:hypothetical protein